MLRVGTSASEAPEGASPAVGVQPAPTLSIVIPTYNERGNIPTVVDRLRANLAGITWELIVVDDDSPDGTASLVKDIGATADGFSSYRARASRIATRFALRAFDLRLSDPMSGFFMLRRAIVDRFAEQLTTQGFKILLDIAITAHADLRIAELPYAFRPRHHGESKLDAGAALEYLGLVLAKASNDLISLRFVLFCFVGATGIAVHFAVLATSLYTIGLDFIWAQIAATMVAIASNFAINNALTYRDRRLKGWAYLGGLLGFYVISLVGVVSNIGVSDWLFSNAQKWWIAGLAGAVIGVVWNYVVASLLVWRTR
jgi:dolichol-phosphate mannosyltransferase